ncbi:PAS modulated sigma54 specific transcriptional regulator, Fis family [uncultured Desulfobacterium sp.]|uniref:PAS modulated sigma54 specific transcriptional regulator, Fis family n=1 Tax=uncultured Desulfobacterium sp. TaxID=201089 RepID=A0A445MR04_9BACT|nr:PAS modulated sigma54 specific transcriptional regulator, Fis family [uncultured Desulfobacterium sp.]
MGVDRIPDNIQEGSGDFDGFPEGDGVLILSTEKKIMSANLQAERLLRIKLPKGENFFLDQIINDQYREKAVSALNSALEGGHSHANLAGKTIAGFPASLTYSIEPLHDNNRIIGAVLTFRETVPSAPGPSKQVRLIEYDTLFEHLAEGVFTINNRWRITSFNQRAQEITGFKSEEVLGRFCWDIFQSDLCHTNCPLKLTMETGIIRMDQDVRILVKGGKKQSILVNTSVMKNKRGLLIGAIETFRPVVEMDLSHEDHRNAASSRPEIIGQSPALLKLLGMLPDVAASDVNVIIEGESGTGKELIARSIHSQSPRSSGPFIPVNCAALAETLLESELFGHVKGAFTGAVNTRAGRFELAKGGTLFLDEIAEIRPEIQVKLLRVLEARVFERVGGARPISMDARIIAATNRDLEHEVKEGRFREDLFYRLRTVPLSLPPLRERIQDIPILVAHFVSTFNKKYQKNVRGVDTKVLNMFKRYAWPGNLRELERALEYAFVFVKGPIITVSHLPELKARPVAPKIGLEDQSTPSLWEDEKITIKKALDKAQGRRDDASRFLGISRTSLWRKMKTHGLI